MTGLGPGYPVSLPWLGSAHQFRYQYGFIMVFFNGTMMELDEGFSGKPCLITS